MELKIQNQNASSRRIYYDIFCFSSLLIANCVLVSISRFCDRKKENIWETWVQMEDTTHYELHATDADARLAWSHDEFELLLGVVAIVRLGGIPLAARALAWELGEEPLYGRSPTVSYDLIIL
jgi:hypothetical protein